MTAEKSPFSCFPEESVNVIPNQTPPFPIPVNFDSRMTDIALSAKSLSNCTAWQLAKVSGEAELFSGCIEEIDIPCPVYLTTDLKCLPTPQFYRVQKIADLFAPAG